MSCELSRRITQLGSDQNFSVILLLIVTDFPPDAIFSEFYQEPYQQAIHKYTQDLEIQAKFLTCVREGMEEIFRRFEFEPDSESALSQHSKCLERLWPHLANLKSFKSCLCCLMFSPE